MVFEAMELIRRNLNAFLGGSTATPDPVVLGNIAFATPDAPGTPVDESAQVYMTMVNVEEEMTMKNGAVVRQSEIRPAAYFNPPIHLNLYVLFSANHHNYSKALENLGKVLTFFQANRSFSLSATPVDTVGIFTTLGEKENALRITLDLMSPTFEQVNHLWGSLGGKQMPFLLYKVRKVVIDAERVLQGGGIIEELNVNF